MVTYLIHDHTMPMNAIALDIGTSGIRALALDTDTGKAGSCAATTGHPIPGSNLFDHLLFAATFGSEPARRIMAKTVNTLIGQVADPRDIETVAICGNTGQISLFLGTEVRDLLMASDALARKGIAVPDRSARVTDATEPGLAISCDILVPPAIHAEVGADALALIHASGMAGKDGVIAIDLGTNAEMALSSGGKVFVGSAAAGPALEGQHIRHGMLAAPGAISGIGYDWGWTVKVLDNSLCPVDSDTIDLVSGEVRTKRAIRARGITGTGVIALVSAGLAKGIIIPPKIHAPGNRLVLPDGIVFTEDDLVEAGKAFGAIRAGQMTLARAGGISFEAIETCHIAGTAGSFVDPLRARDVGIIPPSSETIVRHGNTSLEMAADLAAGRKQLGTLQDIADTAVHVAFSASSVFAGLFIHELAYWSEGAPRRTEPRAVPDPVLAEIALGWIPVATGFFHPRYTVPFPPSLNPEQKICTLCPRGALAEGEKGITIDPMLCRGTSCLACNRAGLLFGSPQG